MQTHRVGIELPAVATCEGSTMRLYTATFASKTPSTHANEGRGYWTRPCLAQLLQQRRRRMRALRRVSARPWILRRGGVSLGRSDASPSFWEAYLSSYVAKIKNAAILIEDFPVTECWAKMGLLFMARPNSYKPRRQLVYCRINVVTTRRNVVNPSYFV